MLAVSINGSFCYSTPLLREKHPGIVVARATAPKLPAIPLQNRHSAGCSFTYFAWGLLWFCYEEMRKATRKYFFFFFFNKWPQKTLDTKQTLCFWQSLKIISWTLALLNGTTFPSFLLRSCPTMQSLNVFQWKQLTACRNTF